MIRALLLLLFVLSGAAGLVYEVAWTRRLVLVLGNSTHAVSLILAAFMMGLAIGSFVFGRFADRLRRPVMLYGILEALIGVYAFVFPLLLDMVTDFYVSLGPATGTSYAVKFSLAFLLLVFPAFLMGGTLPVIVRWATDRLEVIGGRVGAFYGANTFGAVLGSFLAGYVLIEALGVTAATYAAAVGNLAVAAAAIVLGLVVTGARSEPAPEDAPESDAADDRPLGTVVAAFFVSGFCALALEVIWFRELVFFLQGFTWAFCAMLTTFLFGLALGASVLGRIANRVSDPRRFLGWLLLGIAVASAGAQTLLLNMHGVWDWIRNEVIVGAGIPYKYALFAGAFLVLIVPTFLMGGVFPVVSRIVTRRLEDVGHAVGWVYALNTVGAVLGSLVTGLVLIPTAGMAWTVLILVALLLFVAMRVAHVPGGGWTYLAFPHGPVAAGVVILLLSQIGTPFIKHSHVFQGPLGPSRKLLEYKEGSVCAVSVVEDEVTGFRTLYTDEFAAAATGDHYRYMRMLGHLPLMLAPERKDVLVIAFGTGTTAGSCAVHEGVETLDVVEISPEVFEVAHYFKDVNKNVLEREGPPDVVTHVMDGRNFVMTTDRRYDVVTLEPLMPYTPAAVNLYTREFYEVCRRVLKPGGVMCQWIPIHAMSVDHYKMLARSFTDVFPESSVWFFETTSAIIGHTEPGKMNHARLAARAQEPPVAADLRAIGLEDPEAALSCFVTGWEDLVAFLDDVEPMTDEHPTLEYHPVGYGALNSYFADNLGTFFHMRKPVAPHLDLPEAGADALRRELALRYERGQDFLAGQNQEEVWKYLTNARNHTAAARHLAKAVALYESALERAPEIRDPILEAYRDGAKYRQLIFTALGHLNLGERPEAVALLLRAIALSPREKPHQARFLLGRTLMEMGEIVEAERHLAEAVALFPDEPEYGETLAACRAKLEVASEDAVREARTLIGKLLAGEDVGASETRLYELRQRMPGLPGPLEPELRRAEAMLLDLEDVVGKGRSRGLLTLVRVRPSWLQATLDKVVREPRQGPKLRRNAATLAARLPGHEHLLVSLANGDAETRSLVAAALGRARARDATAALVDRLSDEVADVRLQAFLALHAITGQQYGYDPEGSEAERAASIRRWREYLANPPE